MGKLSSQELRRLLACIKRDRTVIVPPAVGYDSGVHLIGDKYVVVSADPCIGVPEEWFGWLLVNYAASDVALFGAIPRFSTINLLGPPLTKVEAFLKIMHQACKAAADLEMNIVTGHTGTYNGLSTLVGTCTAYGIVDSKKLITPGGVKPGDCLLCVKSLGLETISNFAISNKRESESIFGAHRTRALEHSVLSQTCVREALMLSENRLVHAMHDAAEGGLVSAINEMTEASNCGCIIEFEKIQVSKEVRLLQKRYSLSDRELLSLSSTGTFIAAVDPKSEDAATEILGKNGIDASVIGSFTGEKRRILNKNGKDTSFPRKSEDPYAKILSGLL